MSITRTAPAPKRATSSVVLQAGLMTVPLSIYTSVESTSVTRKEFFQGDPNVSVGRVSVRRDTDEVVEREDVTRMAEATDGTWVTLDDAEIVDAVGLTGNCEVVTFVPTKDTNKYLTEGLYQVRPKRDRKSQAAADTAFTLLLAGMKAKKVHALVKFAMRGVPRHALLTATGDMLLISTSDSVREALPMPDVKPSKAEVAMVTNLIDAIGVDTPTVIDDVAPKVQTYIDTKAASNGKVTKAADGTTKPVVVVDMMEVLQASIDQAKKSKKDAA